MSGNINVYYTSTNPVYGKITFNQFIETEVEERGNYTKEDVQKWIVKYKLFPNDKAIWVSPKKWVANRYNLPSEEGDTAENIPESEMSVYEIRANEGFIIPESDDGDEGYLFVYKKSTNYMIREAVNPGLSPGTNERIAKIIEEVKIRPWTASQKREEIVARLSSLSGDIDRKIITEIRSFRPMGTMSELGAAMGAEARKGVRIDTLMGATIFDEKRVPSKERVDRWEAEHKEAERIHGLIPEYAFGIEPRPNTVTGNFRVVEHARRLKNQGLLSQEEELTLNALEKYWKEHPEIDREKGYGIWGHNIDIMVPERQKEKIGGTGMYPTPRVSTTPKVFTYYFRNRPPDIGTYPKGAVIKEAWLPRKVTPKGNMAFGWVSYERELTPDEIKSYELFVDETIMPKLVAELIKFTHDEGINDGYKELKSEYGKAFIAWLKANNEWKPDKGEQAEFLRHLARLTGIKTPETNSEDQEKAKLFLSAIPRFTLDELIQQEATVRRWSIRFPQMEKELEDEYKMYLELRRAEKATAEEARKEKASKPHTEQAKELYKQMRKTNSVRDLDDWRNRVLFEAHLPNVDEDILLRDLAAKWRTYLETRGVPAIEDLTKLPLEYDNDDYYFGTEVWIHPTTTIIDDVPIKGILHTARNGGELWEVAWISLNGEIVSRVPIERLYVTKIVEKVEPRYQSPIKAVTTIDRPVFNPEQAIKIAADSIEQLRRVDVFRVLDTYSNKSKELGDYIKSKRPDLVAEVDKILDVSNEVQQKEETPDQLYAKLFTGWNVVSKGEQAKVSDKDMIYFISTELKIPHEKASKLSLIFKQKLQDEFNEAMSKAKAEREIKRTEEEKQAKVNELKFWNEVKNLKVMDFEVEHDINPDKPSRNYYHVYDRTYAILENGKKVQISYVIYKGEEGKRAVKATKEFYMRMYGQYMGKPLSEWVIDHHEDFVRTNTKSYTSQKPRPRFTFIPETPQQPVVVRAEPIKDLQNYIGKQVHITAPGKDLGKEFKIDRISGSLLAGMYQGTLMLAKPNEVEITTPLVARPADKPQSTQYIKQQYTLKFQLAKSVEELQTIRNEIAFLPISPEDKNQLIDVFSKRYASYTREIPFGIRIPPKMQEKPRILGAQTPQQRFEEEQRRKAADEKRTRGQQKLTSVGSKRLSEFGIKEPMQRYY